MTKRSKTILGGLLSAFGFRGMGAKGKRMELTRANFDEKYYVTKYPHIKDIRADPFLHYMQRGWKEGKDPTAWFSTSEYLKQYPDITESELNPFFHFIIYGRNEGRTARPSASPEKWNGQSVSSDNSDYFELKKQTKKLWWLSPLDPSEYIFGLVLSDKSKN